MENRRVVITGMGTINPLGKNTDETWQAVKEGQCGIAPITAYDTTGRKAKLAGEIKNFDPSDFLPKGSARKMDRFTQLAVIAAKEAFANSGITPETCDLTRCGVTVATGIGGLSTIETEHSRGLEKGFDRVSPFFIPMCIGNMAAGNIAIELGIKGMANGVVTACAGGSNAIGDSMRLIRHGYYDMMICGGSEATVTTLAVGGFTSLKALNETDDVSRASIPFDKERNGFIMGEGAGILVLEELSHAKSRNAEIYGEVVGYGATCDAYHITAPEPDANGAIRCMNEALSDAGIAPEQVGYINAHGTATPMNDKCETAAIHTVFGEYGKKVPVSSTKSMTGHLLGASGAVEAIFCVLALRDGFLPATIHYRVPDEECRLDVIPNVGRSAAVEYALSNSLGFGGHNASLIFKKISE